ncbi:MAG: transposase [Firmicutes bacterium]|nr:transposase [Bacillota bacterium]MCL2770692.1 transposase [Bacillota bacterium]
MTERELRGQASGLPVRKDVRLKSFDYKEPRFYHVVICVQDGHCILSEVLMPTEHELKYGIRGNVGVAPESDPQIKLSSLGKIILGRINRINETSKRYKIDSFVIMPNHIHMIIQILHNGSLSGATPTISLGQIIHHFKSNCTIDAKYKFFQRNYYERIIRNKKELNETRQYIQNNPVNWLTDFYFVYKK